MMNNHHPKCQELVAKLHQIFQIDRPELDFGIYRILNARAGEINDYMQNRLVKKVQQALSSSNDAQRKQTALKIREKDARYRRDGINPNTEPEVQELRQQLAQYDAGVSDDHENAVFSHLLTFFSRYYDQGDFISQRRYKGDTYAIPYAGEEVMLHWANKDQYYTKSGENFNNYSFKLKDGRTVHFRLAAADTAKDNRKDNDKERRFALLEAKSVTRVDENGDEYEEKWVPVEEASGSDGNQELIIRFEYAAQPKGTKQEELVTKAVEAVLADAIVKARWLALCNRAPTEKNPLRTLLEKHLIDYTTKNTADYFIHKDLGGFLRRELDFYIKNEVMHLDDMQNAGAFADIEKNLRMIQCLRSIALELITFLAQLEDFQKKLWLKKKFVVSSHYCITLDRVPEALWPEIVANEQQWDRWKQLGVWDGDAPGTMADLKSAPYRMVDTSLYDAGFQYRLLFELNNVDEKCDGLLVQSDNYQALRLLNEKYKGGINGIYIDPPYNTDATEIIYKNGYKHSSWCALISNRLAAARSYLKPNGILCATIDECEVSNLDSIIKSELTDCTIRPVIIEHNHRGRVKSNFAITHEYALWAIPNGQDLITRKKEISDDIRRNLRRTGTDSTRESSPSQFYGIIIERESLKIVGVTPALQSGESIPPNTDNSKVIVWPIDDLGIERRWYYGSDRVLKESKEGTVWCKIIKGEHQIHYHQDGKPKMRKSVWVGSNLDASTHGSELLNDLFGMENSIFSFPKSIHAVKECLESISEDYSAVFMDFFAGSGTTGHAVIALNREDNDAKRKYVLIEQGEYFHTVTKPRIQKVVYSATWKNGKPTAPETGISHCFKVLKLESYEDTLNNLQLRRTTAQGDLLNTLPQQAQDDYLLSYLLDVESRGSLLSVGDFKKPFDYQLNIAADSAGAFEPRKVDLVETFNYLIGLRIKHIDAHPQRGFVTVTGTLPSGESCLVLWRDCEVLDYEGISKLCDRLAINPAHNAFDVVYLNGDHNIPTVLTQTAKEGGATRVLKLRQIEPEFLERMFSVEDI